MSQIVRNLLIYPRIANRIIIVKITLLLTVVTMARPFHSFKANPSVPVMVAALFVRIMRLKKVT
jgi:hypothetical protein